MKAWRSKHLYETHQWNRANAKKRAERQLARYHALSRKEKAALAAKKSAYAKRPDVQARRRASYSQRISKARYAQTSAYRKMRGLSWLSVHEFERPTYKIIDEHGNRRTEDWPLHDQAEHWLEEFAKKFTCKHSLDATDTVKEKF